MLSLNYVILFLLYWPCARGIEEDHVIDQVATASENIAASLSKNESQETSASLLSSSTEPNDSIVHYENSNGFVPMINGPTYRSSKFLEFKDNSTFTEDSSKKSTSALAADLTSNSENDLYSTEARIFLNLPRPEADRRSFDSQAGQKDFEILKVKDKTPAIANYHEFYQNLQSNMNGKSQSSEGTQSGARFSTRDRIKQIDNYLSYNGDQHRGHSNPYSQYYSHGNSRDTQKQTTFEPEKVRSNYHQHEASDYDIFDESVTRQRATSLPPTNYASIDNSKTSRTKQSSVTKQRHSTPVIVVEPSDYKVDVQYGPQQSSASTKMSSGDVYNHQKDASEDRYDRNEDYSSENSDYYEITERPRRVHKSKRKPYSSDTSRKLPKEHRGSSSDLNELKKLNTPTRAKLHRGRTKPSYWNHENHSQEQVESSEEDARKERPREMTKNDEQQQSSEENSNSWNQVTPNVEISQSNSYDLSHIYKPNLLVPVNLNLVPLNNVDHSTALGNSQGFDITNAGMPNFVTAGPMVSTASPLISSHQPIIMQNPTPQTSAKNLQNIQNGNYAYSTAVPDIIVGQNSFQNPAQSVFLPQQMHNKYTPNVKTYFQSTVAPMFTVNPTIQSTASPKANAVTPHVTVPQFYYPQSTLQPILQTPVTAPTNYNILVNPHGLHGQNIQTVTPPSNNNSPLNTADTQAKKSTFTGSNGQFLASASFSVGHGAQTQNAHANDNNYYVPASHVNNNNLYAGSQNNPQVLRPQLQANVYPVFRNDNGAGKIKTYIPAQVVPTFIQATPGIPAVNIMNQNQGQVSENQQHFVSVGNNILQNTWKQLHQLQGNEQQQQHSYGNRVQYQNVYANRDNIGSTSNNNANSMNAINGGYEKAQLPVVGMQTVEIQNPNINIKPSPVDIAGINQIETINHYPTAMLTTSIPIYSTAASFFTSRPAVTSTSPESISIQSYGDSLTQIGAQNNQGSQLEQKIQHQSTYNPMNFVPSVDLINSQSMLNGKAPDPLPPHLNLVPVVPGGKFYKHSHTAQAELINKPKLSSDLEKYAEEMFKESVRTIYNTHKWNTDKRTKNSGSSENGDLERLKSDLDRLKASMLGSKHGKDVLEAHHSEHQFRTAEPGRPSKRPGLSVTALEELFKSDFKINSDSHSQGSSRPGMSEVTKLTDYLTPPRVNSFISKSPFVDKPAKKRPGKTRSHSRPSSHNSRPASLETAASNHVSYSHRRPHYNRNVHADYRKSKNFDNYPTFTTSSSEEIFHRPSEHYQTSKNDHYDINHPRTHNLLGLLMKSKQLPSGSSSSFFRDDDDYKQYFDNDKRRMHDEAMKIHQMQRGGLFQPAPTLHLQQYH